MPNTLQKNHTITYSESGYDRKMKIPAILNLIQNSTMEHSCNHKISVFDMADRNLTWVMAHFTLSIEKRPKFNDTIKTKTFRFPLRKLYDLRQFQARDSHGNLLFTAKAALILIHKESKRPQRLDKHFSNSFFDQTETIEFNLNRLTPRNFYESSHELTPGFNDIDFNNHVNNTVYTNWAIDSIPVDYIHSHKLRKIDVNFKGESFLGDRIISKLNITGNESGIKCDHQVCLKDSEKSIALLSTLWEK